MLSVKISSELRNWQTLTWAEYVKYDTSKHIDSNFVSESDIFFKAIIVRGLGKTLNKKGKIVLLNNCLWISMCLILAKLIIVTAIKPNYPCSAPILTLQLDWNGKTFNSTNNINMSVSISKIQLKFVIGLNIYHCYYLGLLDHVW